MSLITNLDPTSELEAVNKMLRAIGEAPVTDLTTAASLTDVAMALAELKDATREVQTLPWKFNSRFQVPLSPAGTQAWTDPDGTALTLNVFTVPSRLVSFLGASKTATQFKQGRNLDLAIMPSVVYTPGTLVFFDRTYNRDGLIATDFPKLYIDAIYAFDFVQLPETARHYITVLAARRFVASVVGSSELRGFALADEAQALRELKRDQGSEDEFNMLNHPDVARVLGYRPRTSGSVMDSRRVR